MWYLVYKELVQLRTYLLQIVVLMVMAIIVFGGISSAITMAYLYALPPVLSLNLPQIMFMQEERRNTFAFLRSLPIHPREIVASKYLALAVVASAFLAGIGFAGMVRLVSLEEVMVAITTLSLMSFTLAGLSFFLHFWLGLKSARLALMLVIFCLAIPMAVAYRDLRGFQAKVAATLGWLKPLAASPLGVSLALAAGLAVFAVSYAASAWLFTKRDLSRLP